LKFLQMFPSNFSRDPVIIVERRENNIPRHLFFQFQIGSMRFWVADMENCFFKKMYFSMFNKRRVRAIIGFPIRFHSQFFLFYNFRAINLSNRFLRDFFREELFFPDIGFISRGIIDKIDKGNSIFRRR